MFKKIMMASLAVGALALGAPAAQADEPTVDCNFSTVQQEASTGQSFEGAAYGYVVHAGDTGATIRCYIAVNGSEVSSTPVGTGVTAGRLTYSAGETDVVTFHAEACTNHGTCTVTDYETVRSQIPPQEVIDALDAVFQIIADGTAPLDPIICGALKTAGVPALVNGLGTPVTLDTDDCDIYLSGERLIDFVPYED